MAQSRSADESSLNPEGRADSAPEGPGPRALGLDALRGLAIFGMVLSSRIPPFGFEDDPGVKPLPGWMYHAQEMVNPILKGAHPPGLSWVDLVFPMFLFAMGAAFPFALSRRLERGATGAGLVLGVLARFGRLVFFAFYLQHTVPHVLGGSTADQWIGLLAFLILFPVFMRFPRTWPVQLQSALRVGGWAAAIALLALLPLNDGGGLSPGRVDIIILVLANMALFGSLIWLVTRGHPGLRLASLAVGLLGHFSMGGENHITLGMADLLAPLNQIPVVQWVFKLLFLKYLLIVIPGTIIGDMLLRWMGSPRSDTPGGWPRQRLWVLAALMAAVVFTALTGYQARWQVLTPIALVALSALGLALVRRPFSDTERLLRGLLVWATVWLALGILTEPFEGGVKKTPSTLSYQFLPLALSIHMLIALTVVIDVLGHRRWGLGVLIGNGQNPMLAYAGIRGLLGPFYILTGIDTWLTLPIFRLSAWAGAAWGLFKSLTLAWVVARLTCWKILWRT